MELFLSGRHAEAATELDGVPPADDTLAPYAAELRGLLGDYRGAGAPEPWEVVEAPRPAPRRPSSATTVTGVLHDAAIDARRLEAAVDAECVQQAAAHRRRLQAGLGIFNEKSFKISMIIK